jgi:hypothetical protein
MTSIVTATASNLAPHGFEVLLDTYFQGWTGFAYDENDAPVVFATVEEALVDLQEAFDSVSAAARNGERPSDQSYLARDFAIRALASAELCAVGLLSDKIVLLDGAGKPIASGAAFARINRSGRFGDN